MELDSMKRMWEDCDRKLDANLRLSRRLLSAPLLRKAQGALTRLSLVTAAELVLTLAALVWLGWFESNHYSQARFMVPAVLLHVGAIALLAACARQIIAIRRIDFSAPIVAIQRELETIRIAEIHATRWTLLLAPLAWTPFFIVALKGLFGIDAYTTFNPAWLAANVLFGVAVVVLERWISFRYAERMQRSPRLQRWMRDISGYNLKAARNFLGSAAELEKESA